VVLLPVGDGDVALSEMCEAFLLLGFCFRSVLYSSVQTLWVASAEEGGSQESLA
jgi:hypothetical protein